MAPTWGWARRKQSTTRPWRRQTARHRAISQALSGPVDRACALNNRVSGLRFRRAVEREEFATCDASTFARVTIAASEERE
ncbi:MAG: hypothetical protein HC923_09580 [Myxococcales bacterium]|nr:hypothetical protein [Myxococcales bacterium]